MHHKRKIPWKVKGCVHLFYWLRNGVWSSEPWKGDRQIRISWVGRYKVHCKAVLGTSSSCINRKENSEGIQIKREIRQGCVLSPYLYNLFTELIFRVIENDDKGVPIGERRTSKLRYADDTGMATESERKLQVLVNRENEEGKHFGIKSSIKKAKPWL